MMDKFIHSGYSLAELNTCKMKALSHDRDKILKEPRNKEDKEEQKSNDDVITFVMNHDPTMASHLRSFFMQKKDILKQLIGDKRIVISERKSPNTASLTFAKSSFSMSERSIQNSQQCGSTGCLTCPTMTLPRNLVLNGIPVKLDFSLNCKTENCIYVGKCKFCDNPIEFYLGQTFNHFCIRCNNHRNCFKVNEKCKYKESALSLHIFEKHLDLFDSKLENFSMGIIKSVNPMNLARSEDYFIWKTNADTISLKRYKAISKFFP